MIDKTLFIFRRDLRLEDNTGLIFALKHSSTVIPCFIFTPDQIEHNRYLSAHCLQFMIESLEDLDEELKHKKTSLYLFYGNPEDIVLRCIEELKIGAVVVNRDYTPYSISRDKKIKEVCEKKQVTFRSFDDALLNPPETTLKADKTPYTIFTPYFKNAAQFEIDKPVQNTSTNYYRSPISFAEKKGLYETLLPQRRPLQKGGRKEALVLLKQAKHLKTYALERDFPAIEATTHLSAHLKFTTCSIRETYEQIELFELRRSLYWRDFFTCIAFFFPHVFKGAFHKKYDALTWNPDKEAFKRWCEGKTGFPLVDAGMRQMNETGWMHNRVRMVVGSFLVKDLHINWRWGEQYFARTLLDYDPAVNNGNWQWVASTGCDATPYFRIFNPWNQQVKFDPECTYIKKWVPELKDIDPKRIHKWYLEKNPSVYCVPMVDHTLEAKLCLAHYKNLA